MLRQGFNHRPSSVSQNGSTHLNRFSNCNALSLGLHYIYSKVDKPFKTKFHIPITQGCIA